jgi:hypothetical protein
MATPIAIASSDSPTVLQSVKDRLKGWAVFAIIIVIAAFLTFTAIKIVRAFKKPPNAKYVQSAPIPVGWTPTKVTDDIYNAIDGTFVMSATKDAAYKAFNDLNDNQMIAVYNDWNDRYHDNKAYYIWPYGSLTNAIKNKTGYVSIGGTNNQDVALANLNRLQLT